jgi:hypothetical protein
VSVALHAAAIAAIVIGLFRACRFVYRRSRVAGLMFTAGLLVRAIAAAFFLVVSYYELPLMRGLQLGNGFWTLAPDAEEYYRLGSLVAAHWQDTIVSGYIAPLALWMRVVGVNPVSPVLFNLVMYSLAVVIFVWAFGQGGTRAAQHALHLGVAAFSVSPMFVYAAVFGLKDVYFVTLVVAFGVAYVTLIGSAGARETSRTTLLAVAGAALALGLIAATRTYFAIILWATIAVTYAGCVVAGVPSRRRFALQAAAVLPLLALVIVGGAEDKYPSFVGRLLGSVPGAVIERRVPMARAGLDELDRRRRAIDRYGGNSMLSRDGASRDSASRDGASPDGASRDDASRAERLAVGLGAVFVPSAILSRLAGVSLQIGTSARLVADADTVVFDAMTVVMLWLLIVNRRQINVPPLLFGLTLTVLVALPLAYVMTNYGTLIRLRLLVAAPIWLLGLALAPGFSRVSPPSSTEAMTRR